MNFLSNIFETHDKNISYEKISDVEFEKVRLKNKSYILYKSKKYRTAYVKKLFFQISHYFKT